MAREPVPASLDIPSDVPASGATLGVLELLSDILEVLTTPADESPAGCPLPCFCRVAVYPGLEVPLDSCDTGGSCDECDGQLWGAIQSVTRMEQPGAAGSPCEAWQWSAQVGAVRCAAKPKDDGSPPSIDAVQDDSVRQAIDADGIWYAIKCCPERSQRLKDAGIVLDSWTPLGPDGGCVGGFWTIRGRFDVCC